MDTIKNAVNVGPYIEALFPLYADEESETEFSKDRCEFCPNCNFTAVYVNGKVTYWGEGCDLCKGETDYLPFA